MRRSLDVAYLMNKTELAGFQLTRNGYYVGFYSTFVWSSICSTHTSLIILVSIREGCWPRVATRYYA